MLYTSLDSVLWVNAVSQSSVPDVCKELIVHLGALIGCSVSVDPRMLPMSPVDSFDLVYIVIVLLLSMPVLTQKHNFYM